MVVMVGPKVEAIGGGYLCQVFEELSQLEQMDPSSAAVGS